MPTTTFRGKIAASLGLTGAATDDELVAAFRRSLRPADQHEDPDDPKTDDPREIMTAHALTEQSKAEASGRPISFTEALTRARRANPKLDQVLTEGYAVGRWTR